MEAKDAVFARCSVRKYSPSAEVERGQLEEILAAGLAAATGRGKRSYLLQVVSDWADLVWLSACRAGGSASMLEGAAAAVLVWGFPDVSDTWIEDCSLVMGNMMLRAADMGLGTCWVQARGRSAAEGATTQQYVEDRFAAPEGASLECILSLGVPQAPAPARSADQLPWEKVAWGRR